MLAQSAELRDDTIVKLVLFRERAFLRLLQGYQIIFVELANADEARVSYAQSLRRDADFRLLVQLEVMCSALAEKCADYSIPHHINDN